MKRKILIIFSILFLLNAVTIYANTSLYGYFQGFEKIRVLVDNKELKSNVPAFLVEGSTVLPLRAVAESLSTLVFWDAENKTVKLTKPNVNMQFTANPVYDADKRTYVVYSPFGKISKTQRYKFSFHVYSEVDNLPNESVEIKVNLRDPDDNMVSEGTIQTFDATIENSLQYINYFKEIDFLKTGNYYVELLVRSQTTKYQFVKIGQKMILVK